MKYITRIDDPIAQTERILREVPAPGQRRPVVRPVTLEIANALAASPLVLVVAERGAGATSAVEALGWELRARPRGHIPTELRRRRLFRTSVPEIQAGCTYVNQLEGRLQVLDGLIREADGILMIEGFHLAGTAGATKDDTTGTIANLLEPYTRNGLRTVGITTPAGLDYLSIVAADTVQGARVVTLPAATEGESIELLTAGPRSRAFNEGIAREAVRYAERFMPNRALPGSAAALLREAGVSGHVTSKTLQHAVTSLTGLRPEFIDPDISLELAKVEASLAAQVIGQSEATHCVARAITRVKSGVGRPGRPIASALFMGPTGVGKTELAKAAARILFGDRAVVIQLDMSEYVGYDAAQRFLGGHGHRGLVQRCLAHPHAVILLDELEKADTDVILLVLQLLDEARLTATNGHVADLSAAIIYMTSNLGNRPRRAPGLMTTREHSEDGRTQLLRYLPTELVNRIDDVISFQHLNEDTIHRIAKRELDVFRDQAALRSRGLALHVGDAMIQQLVERGYDPRFGARAMQRTVRALLEDPIAATLAAQPSLRDATVVISAPGAVDVVEAHDDRAETGEG